MARRPQQVCDVWVTVFWTYDYAEHALAARLVDGTLRIACEYERFKWLEGEDGGEPMLSVQVRQTTRMNSTSCSAHRPASSYCVWDWSKARQPTPSNNSRRTRMTASLSELDASIVKGMLLRGDNQHDIAAYYGVNPGRVAEVKKGIKHGAVPAAPADRLPSSGAKIFRAARVIDPEAPLAEQIEALRLLILTTPPLSPAIVLSWCPPLADYVVNHLNEGNRHFRPAKIRQIIGAIERGWWDVTGDTIKFGSYTEAELAKGMGLRDGQNRLSAIAQAGRVVESYVVFSITPTAFARMDVGAGRTAADTFHTYGVANAGTAAPATRWLKIFAEHVPPATPNRGLSLTNDEIWEYYTTQVDAARLQHCVQAAKSASHGILPVSSLTALFYIFTEHDKTCADLFIQDLQLDMRGAGKVIARAKKLKTVRLSRVHEHEYIAPIIMGWNDYRAGNTRLIKQKLEWDPEKSFPAIK